MVDFKAHLKKIRAQAAPSLNPPPRKAAKAVEVIPDLREVVSDEQECSKIQHLAELHASFGVQERTAKRAKENIADGLKVLCNDYALLKVQAGDVRVNYYLIKRATIQADLLRARGVSQSIINDCTTTTESWALRTSLPGVRDEEEE